MRPIQFSAIAILLTCSTVVMAGGFDYTKEDLSGYNLQPNLTVNDDSDFSRSGHAVYFFGGYAYTHRFLRGTRRTLTATGQSDVTYSPDKVVPNTFNGIEMGIGKEWSRHIDFQLSYVQQLRTTKTATYEGRSFSYGVKMNGALVDAAYVFNPDDQFQVLGKFGVMFSEFYNSITVNNVGYRSTNDGTKLDPAAGMEFLWQFTKHVGMRVNFMYIAESQSRNSDGEMSAFAGLNYVL